MSSPSRGSIGQSSITGDGAGEDTLTIGREKMCELKKEKRWTGLSSLVHLRTEVLRAAGSRSALWLRLCRNMPAKNLAREFQYPTDLPAASTPSTYTSIPFRSATRPP